MKLFGVEISDAVRNPTPPESSTAAAVDVASAAAAPPPDNASEVSRTLPLKKRAFHNININPLSGEVSRTLPFKKRAFHNININNDGDEILSGNTTGTLLPATGLSIPSFSDDFYRKTKAKKSTTDEIHNISDNNIHCLMPLRCVLPTMNTIFRPEQLGFSRNWTCNKEYSGEFSATNLHDIPTTSTTPTTGGREKKNKLAKKPSIEKKKVKSDDHEKKKAKSSNDEKKKAKLSPNNEDDNVIIPLEEFPGLLQKIESHNGSKPVFLYKKKLEVSDVRDRLNRLFISGCKANLMGFLTDEERTAVDADDRKGLEFVGIDKNGEFYNLRLVKWSSVKITVINKEWMKIIRANDAHEGDSVELWGYRRNNNNEFCLVLNFRKSENINNEVGSSSGSGITSV
ncbi:hypothetical protein ACP275_02G143000 [Erythranthe tilingii]